MDSEDSIVELSDVNETDLMEKANVDDANARTMQAAIDDPFEIREGKSLTWCSVNMVLVPRGRKPGKTILNNVWGEVPRKETTAIMGPSGAGKTCLLNVLAGRASTNARIEVTSDVRLDNFAVKPSDMEVRKQIAFVSQDDSLYASSTPRECIMFSAKLRLPRSMSDEQLETITNRMLEELGLVSCADTIVGSELVKGISGGERKRTSVGVELVTKPAMVFLDEPTSGLDSFSAVQLCKVLKKVANAGASVLFTIHQPASEIFDSFDHLILLNKSRVMYEGSVDSVPDYFEARGQPLPPKYNPADWIMIVAQSFSEEELERDGFYAKNELVLSNSFSAVDVVGKDALGNTIKGDKPRIKAHATMLTEIKWLLWRELAGLVRDKTILGARLFLTGFMTTLIGIIFWKVGETNSAITSNINSHFGAEIVVLMSAMFGTALPSLMVFPQERPVFLREYSTNHYSAVSYFTSRLGMEMLITAIQMTVLVIVSYFMVGFQLSLGWHWIIVYSLAMASTAIAVLLGSSVEDPTLATEFLPLCFVPQLLFAGFFVSPELIPGWLRWLQYIMPLTFATKLHMNQEFNRNCGSLEGDHNCQMLLESVNVVADDVWWYWLVLLGLFIVYRFGALITLSKKASKYY